MIGRTLFFYLSKRFSRWILGIFLIGAVLVFIVDFFELMRRIGDEEGFSIAQAALLSVMRTPSLTERILPFATLFGSMAAFVGLTRRSELVVIRAAGVSIWQFMLPPIIVALIVGCLATSVYNPISAWLKDRADLLSVELFGREQLIMLQTTQQVWVRQRSDQGESVLHARRVANQGHTINGVTIFAFDRSGEFKERIEADSGTLEPGYWDLHGVTSSIPDSAPTHVASLEFPTRIKAEEIMDQIAQPDAVSFWQLRELIDRAERAGVAAYPYRLQLQTLISLPVFLASMVLIAATVSLRVSRFGGTGRLVASGVAAGFVLYVATEMARDLGNVGIVAPAIAAWAPGIVATLLGVTVLLHKEDG